MDKYVELRPKRDGRLRPFIKGTRVEVLHIVCDSEHHSMSAEEIARGHEHIPLAAIYAALAYYHDDRDAIRTMLREDKQITAKLLKNVNATHLSQAGRHEDASTVSP